VGVTAGSREVPGRKPVTRDNDDDDDDNNNNNILIYIYIYIYILVPTIVIFNTCVIVR
jgi:hypothetical protein